MIVNVRCLIYTEPMCDVAVPPGISDADWATTPPPVRELISALQATVAQLHQQVVQLQERLQQNSQNSSRPPSADPPYTRPRPPRRPSGRKPGGQPGHVGHGRKLKPAAEVTRVVDVRPVACARCGALLLGADPTPVRHQVTDLPRVVPEVVEYRQHTVPCLVCGAHTQADLPPTLPPGSFGPRLQATVGYLTGRLGLSQRDVAETLDTVFHTDLSLGSVPALEQAVSTALAAPVEQAHHYVQQQAVVNADETGWREKAQRGWLWLATTPQVTVFLIQRSRSKVAAQHLLGATFAGILGSDRYPAYRWVAVEQRQVCWAHLQRDCQALVERGAESARLGQALLAQVHQMFDLWYQVRAGTLNRAEFQTAMTPIRHQVGELLREGAAVPHPKTSHTCANILKLEAALWTFVTVAGVEPTNNDAERPLRRAVLWRRRSFGTQSAAGSQFVARVLTAVTTLRQQRRDVLDYLTAAGAAAICGAEAPSLLPAPQTVQPAADLLSPN